MNNSSQSSNPSTQSSNGEATEKQERVLLRILVKDSKWNEKQQALKDLDKFIKNKRPTFSGLENILLSLSKKEYQILLKQTQNPLTILVKDYLAIYCESNDQCYSFMISKLFVKIFNKLKTLFPEAFDESVKKIAVSYWKKIDAMGLQSFLETFQIREFIKPEEKVPKIKKLLQSQFQLKEAVTYIVTLDIHQHFDLPSVITLLSNKKENDAIVDLVEKSFKLQDEAIKLLLSKQHQKPASEIVKKYNLNPHDYPTLIPLLKRASLRFHMQDSDWTTTEERFCDDKEVLGFFVEELIQNGKIDEAMSIVQRHKLLEDPNNLPINTLQKAKLYFPPNKKTFKYLENELFQKDAYAPTEELIGKAEPGIYFHLKDFGIDIEKDFYWIDDAESKDFDHAISEVLKADYVGFDTEFKFMVTRFTRSGTALLQLATEKEVFLIDSIKLENSPKYNQFIKDFLSSPTVNKVGHTLSADLTQLRTVLEGYNDLTIHGTVDISKIFRELYPDAKYSLAAICAHFLPKQMSKYEQMSNWGNRPLRKSQMHYGALDAVIVLDLLKRIKEVIASKGLDVEAFIHASQQPKKKTNGRYSKSRRGKKNGGGEQAENEEEGEEGEEEEAKEDSDVEEETKESDGKKKGDSKEKLATSQTSVRRDENGKKSGSPHLKKDENDRPSETVVLKTMGVQTEDLQG